jgi:hypothetical protein
MRRRDDAENTRMTSGCSPLPDAVPPNDCEPKTAMRKKE